MEERREKPKEEAAEVRGSGASQLSHCVVSNESAVSRFDVGQRKRTKYNCACILL